jgi:hypothetical protein
VEKIENDSLPKAALADLQWLAEQVGELFEDEDASRENVDAARVELELLRDGVHRVTGEHPNSPLERLVLEHRADQRPQGRGTAADGDRLIRMLDLDALEEIVDVIAQPADLGGGRRVVGEELVGDRPRANLEGLHLANAVGDRPEDDLG